MLRPPKVPSIIILRIRRPLWYHGRAGHACLAKAATRLLFDVEFFSPFFGAFHDVHTAFHFVMARLRERPGRAALYTFTAGPAVVEQAVRQVVFTSAGIGFKLHVDDNAADPVGDSSGSYQSIVETEGAKARRIGRMALGPI